MGRTPRGAAGADDAGDATGAGAVGGRGLLVTLAIGTYPGQPVAGAAGIVLALAIAANLAVRHWWG